MALIPIVQGPSKWDMMLATFDRKPATMLGARKLRFGLITGHEFTIELTGLDWGPYPSVQPWQLRGHDHGSFPKGYASEQYLCVEFGYDPTRHQGMIELYLVSPCHTMEIITRVDDGLAIGVCSQCDAVVTRVNPKTQVEEWLGKEVSPRTEALLVPTTTDPRLS
jgi:hypothetical protein